ncbi:MAG: hypothetical protein IKW00_02960 [Clostridia bacterium]|nr:hypothetical protein [Clostridia bacterium]
MRQKEIAGNLDTGALKLWALIFMIADHAGVRIYKNIPELRMVGRIAFPLYAWCLVVGTVYTRRPLKYALRMFMAAVISQPFYMIALNHGWDQLNILFTLLLGYFAIAGIRIRRNGSHVWAPLAAVLCTEFVKVDYGAMGVVLVILLYLCRERRGALAAGMAIFCLYWGQSSSVVTSLFGYRLTMPGSLTFALYDSKFFGAFFRLQTFALLALPFILMQSKKRTAFPKWAAYAAYPGHLFILWLVQLMMGKTTLSAAKMLLIPWM